MKFHDAIPIWHALDCADRALLAGHTDTDRYYRCDLAATADSFSRNRLITAVTRCDGCETQWTRGWSPTGTSAKFINAQKVRLRARSGPLHYRPQRRSVHRFDRDAEHVPCAAFGKDVARFRGIGFELVPQPHDLGIDRAVVNVVIVQAGHVAELVARGDAMRRAEGNHDQTEIAVAEPYGLA